MFWCFPSKCYALKMWYPCQLGVLPLWTLSPSINRDGHNCCQLSILWGSFRAYGLPAAPGRAIQVTKNALNSLLSHWKHNTLLIIDASDIKGPDWESIEGTKAKPFPLLRKSISSLSLIIDRSISSRSVCIYIYIPKHALYGKYWLLGIQI